MNMMSVTQVGTKLQLLLSHNLYGFPMILDIDRVQFKREALRLLGIVATEFQPDILIGIRSGGYRLAEAIAEQRPAGAMSLVSVTRRRPSTKFKNQKKLKQVLGIVPKPVKDALRRLEHRYQMAVTSRQVEPMVPDPEEDRALRAAVAAFGGSCRILVVDDAVDSGATLFAVLRYVREAVSPAADVRSAVITVTHSDPIVEPDYTLYRQVLCRFYWSADFA